MPDDAVRPEMRLPLGEALLAVERVNKRFVSGSGEIEALRGVDLEVQRREFVCLIGSSGCGKSTLLRLIGGFETPSEGKVLMRGRPVTGPGPDRGMVFQDYGLFPWLSVRGNIGFGLAARGLPRSQVAATADRFIEMIGLARFADVYPHQLSGGMKQRVAIARVLANQAELVLMDEPFGALDAMTRERLQAELLMLWQSAGLTVIFVTHSIEEAIVLADRVVLMSPGPGRIVADVPVALPRPRDVASVPFNAIRRRLAALLHGSDDAVIPLALDAGG
jgi:NitT/TauT family transport system ATP-binding protein